MEQTRSFEFLDGCRHPVYADQVQVHLIREGLKPEVRWARITGLGENFFLAELLEEPKQDFGYHTGDAIAFFLEKEGDQTICCSNMTPVLQYTADELADGSVLKSAIHTFETERIYDRYYDVLEILRDSQVWISYLQIPGIETAMVPALVSSGDESFLPVFSSMQEMGKFGEGMITEKKTFLEVLALAVGIFKGTVGIVVNPYTEQFVLEKGMLDIVQGLKSNLKR